MDKHSMTSVLLAGQKDLLALIRAKVRVRGYVLYSEIQGLLAAYEALARACQADQRGYIPRTPREEATLLEALQALRSCQELAQGARQFIVDALQIRADHPRAFNSLSKE